MQDVWEIRNAFMCRRTDKGARHFISGCRMCRRMLPDFQDTVMLCIQRRKKRKASALLPVFGMVMKRVDGPKRVSAVLVPDAMADPDGSLVTRCVSETVYYEPGEIPLDADGNRIPKIRYIEETVPGETKKLYGNWTEIPANGEPGVWHVESSYTDFYGALHSDEQKKEYQFKLVLPGSEQIVLSAEEASMLSGNWAAGDSMGRASYYLAVKQASVRACLDHAAGMEGTENSFVKRVVLLIRGQECRMAGRFRKTGKRNPVQSRLAVEERSIRQRIRVSKTIEKTSYRNTSSYADVHEDSVDQTIQRKNGSRKLPF